MLQNEIEETRIEFCQRYMTAEDYYDLKSFSYFTEEGFSKENFIKECKLEDAKKLPFRLLNN